MADWHFSDIEKTIDKLGDATNEYNRDGLEAVAHLGRLGGMINFGRDALQIAGPTKQVFGVPSKDIVPTGGDQVFDGKRQVGMITTGAWSPFLEHGIGYVQFTQSGKWAGQTLSLKSKNSGDTRVEIIDLPFYDKDKRLPRDLSNLRA